MVNPIKESGDGLALQITKPARAAGLVQELPNGDADRSDVYVYGFDGLLVVLDESVDMGHRADIVSSAAGDTESMHSGRRATVAQGGNGHQVNLPGCKQAGFEVGDDAPVVPAPGMLVIHDGTNARIAEDLKTLRKEQTA
jgi:hypothetical protein